MASITRDAKTSLYTIKTLNHSTVLEDTRLYRGVILAAPFHTSSIKLSLSPAALEIPPQPYVPLHVTLLSTPSSHINASYFGLPDNSFIPGTVLTSYEGARNGGPEPEFNSISIHGKVTRKDGEPADKEEYLVKVFSKERAEDEWLESLFGKVGWVYRKVVSHSSEYTDIISTQSNRIQWDAYPVLPPTSQFPPVKIDQGLYYVNAFEPYVYLFKHACRYLSFSFKG